MCILYIYDGILIFIFIYCECKNYNEKIFNETFFEIKYG